jgi:hypothetical protein
MTAKNYEKIGDVGWMDGWMRNVKTSGDKNFETRTWTRILNADGT